MDRDKGLREKLVKESTIQNEKSFRLRKPSQKYNQASGVELLEQLPKIYVLHKSKNWGEIIDEFPNIGE